MYVHKHSCVWFLHVCLCVSTYPCVCVYVHTCVPVQVNTCVYESMCILMYVHIVCVPICMFVYMFFYMWLYVLYVCPLVYMHPCIHIWAVNVQTDLCPCVRCVPMCMCLCVCAFVHVCIHTTCMWCKWGNCGEDKISMERCTQSPEGKGFHTWSLEYILRW